MTRLAECGCPWCREVRRRAALRSWLAWLGVALAVVVAVAVAS